MSPKPVAVPTIFSEELYWQRVTKIPEIKLNRKMNITWHKPISEIGQSWLKLIYEIQIT